MPGPSSRRMFRASSAAVQAVKALRYDKEEYFWINDQRPNMVMHPFKPQLDGKDLSQIADPTGKKLVFVGVYGQSVETINVDGTGQTVVAHDGLGGGYGSPVFSPEPEPSSTRVRGAPAAATIASATRAP